MQPTQADSEIEEEHLLNFVVNSLGDELPIALGENVKVTSDELYEVFAGASAGGTSINHVCETTDKSPHVNTVRGHLTDSICLELLYARNYAYAMPIVKWGETIKAELSRGWSRVIEHELAGRVTFPVFIDCVYQRGRYDEHGVARHGYAVDAPFITTP